MCAAACVEGSLEAPAALKRMQMPASSGVLSRGASSGPGPGAGAPRNPPLPRGGRVAFICLLQQEEGGRARREGRRNWTYFWETLQSREGPSPSGSSALWTPLGEVGRSRPGIPASCFSSVGVTTNERTALMGQRSGVMYQGSGRRTGK